MRIRLADERATADFAAKAARILRGGDSVALIGALGAGKTTFTRWLVRALGGLHDASSPTYVLEHEYATSSGLTVKHWDLYRLSEIPPELLEPAGKGEIRLIEWADKFPELIADFELSLSLGYDPAAPECRTAALSGPRAAELAALF